MFWAQAERAVGESMPLFSSPSQPPVLWPQRCFLACCSFCGFHDATQVRQSLRCHGGRQGERRIEKQRNCLQQRP